MQIARRPLSLPRVSGLLPKLAGLLPRAPLKQPKEMARYIRLLDDPDPAQRKRAIRYLAGLLNDPSFRDQALDLLCGFIRQTAPRHSPVLVEDPADWAAWGAERRARLPSDIELALTLLARAATQHPDAPRPDLSNLRLAALFLGQRNLSRMNLRDSSLAGANLMHARLTDARLFRTDLRGAKLDGAQMQGALLADTRLEQASLIRTNLSHAQLIHADLTGTDLSRATLSGAFLWRNVFTETTQLDHVTLTGAALRDMDLRESNLDPALLLHAFGDASVRLAGDIAPNSALWPDHWARKPLGHNEFRARWRNWQSKIGFQARQNPQ